MAEEGQSMVKGLGLMVWIQKLTSSICPCFKASDSDARAFVEDRLDEALLSEPVQALSACVPIPFIYDVELEMIMLESCGVDLAFNNGRN